MLNNKIPSTPAFLVKTPYTIGQTALPVYASLISERKGHCMADGRKRADIRPGLQVDIVLKKDQPTGKLTRGIVKDILTKSPDHPHGIKVRLESGDVGRVKNIIE